MRTSTRVDNPARPLAGVLAANAQEFIPEHPRRPPWHQPTLRGVEVATTGNVAAVPLVSADKAQLRNLARPSGCCPESRPVLDDVLDQALHGLGVDGPILGPQVLQLRPKAPYVAAARVIRSS